MGKLKALVSIVRNLVAPVTPHHRDYARLDIIRIFARFVLPRYRFEWPSMDWWNNPDFNAYLDRFGLSRGLMTRNKWMVNELLKLAKSIPGDTAECGVFEGATSYLICKAMTGMPRTHFVFDSFEGLSAPTLEDGNEWSAGMLNTSLEHTRANLPFPNISYHKGWIPERFPDVEHRRFAFVHIDVDLYQPTIDSFKFFYPRMNSGGLIVCDDYGFSGCPGATQAVNEFMADRPEEIISPPCGGCFIIKKSPN